MTGELNASGSDQWSRWLLTRRHGDDAAYKQRVLCIVHQIADRVLDAARLGEGMTLADIGAGDGLVAFRGIARVGPTLRAILTDLSRPLLEHARARAGELGVEGQCRFVQGSAEKLAGLEDESVDRVTTRAMLTYVADKPAVLREFYRILKPGGILSIAEPVFQDEASEANAMKRWLDTLPAEAEVDFQRIYQRLKAAQFPATDEQLGQSPLTNTNERDLLRMVRKAGFVEGHLELHVDVRPFLVRTWESYLQTAPHPLSPTAGEILAGFTPQEQACFEATMRPIIEAGSSEATDFVAYVNARRP